MQTYFTKADDFELEGSFTKGGLISFIEQLDEDNAPKVSILEANPDEKRCDWVTLEIALEMANAHQFHAFDDDFDSETGIPAFALHHCEDELRERLAEETDETLERVA